MNTYIENLKKNVNGTKQGIHALSDPHWLSNMDDASFFNYIDSERAVCEYHRVFVTPQRAKAMLERYNNKGPIKQRPWKNSVYRKYCSIMTKGKWLSDTGDGLGFTRTKSLIQGQHTLSAIVATKKSYWLLMSLFLGDDVFAVLDSQAKRSGGDVLGAANIANGNKMAANIYFYLDIDKSFLGDSNTRATASDLVPIAKAHEPFWQWVVAQTQRWYKEDRSYLSPAQSGGILAFLSFKAGSENALAFMNDFFSKSGGRSSQAIVLKALFRKAKQDNNTSLFNAEEKAAFFIQGFNAYVKKKKITIDYFVYLRANKSIGQMKSSFPTVVKLK